MERQGTLTFKDLVQLVELIKASANFNEFHLRMGDVELDLRRGDAVDGSAPAVPAGNGAASRTPAPAPAPASVSRPPEPAASSASAATTEWPADSTVVKSPMVGTFYRSPEPGAKAFVEVGDAVEAEATVCIIEVMKLMNSIAAGAGGVVTHVLVEDGDPVEYGQPLIVIAPKSAGASA
ncbi:acetyl-CoA carboxylase biotin carboxyl carrier protein [Caballeronia sp. EK]|uniref:acetyl-CoA carboxylase biotin carboxyl carrier protein n=1 Tax=Caballeronia sp. EK TaxID=2767469 RepID=UPI001655BF8F|nr:acetyl-CoA carboxylase biotin carboxyl carrier protein [Caballeronia sp. EK]MBC8642195.1 acetyl-CoA carboxylase biotin carboxyl carrier protein [Caballeronia sp. EK]